MLSTTIIVPSFNEERYIARSLGSLQEQTVVQAYPEQFQLMVVDSNSEDKTAEIATQMGWTVMQTGMGKLSARDWGIRMASNEVIFAADADCRYDPDHLEKMLRHMEDPSVVGVYGPYATDHPILQYFAPTRLFQPERFMGMNNLSRRDAYLNAPFDLNIDQQDRWTMIMEEELNFLHRLEAQGKVVYERGAVAFHSNRRWTQEDDSFNEQVKSGKRFEAPQPFW